MSKVHVRYGVSLVALSAGGLLLTSATAAFAQSAPTVSKAPPIADTPSERQDRTDKGNTDSGPDIVVTGFPG